MFELRASASARAVSIRSSGMRLASQAATGRDRDKSSAPPAGASATASRNCLRAVLLLFVTDVKSGNSVRPSALSVDRGSFLADRFRQAAARFPLRRGADRASVALLTDRTVQPSR